MFEAKDSVYGLAENTNYYRSNRSFYGNALRGSTNNPTWGVKKQTAIYSMQKLKALKKMGRGESTNPAVLQCGFGRSLWRSQRAITMWSVQTDGRIQCNG